MGSVPTGGPPPAGDMEALRRRIAELEPFEARHRQAQEMLRDVAAGVSAKIGPEFFRSLAAYLSRALGADYVLIGKLEGEPTDSVRTLAVCASGQLVDNLTYALPGTPCENVVTSSLCTYPSGVGGRFPRDTLLAEMQADSYVGTPLHDSAGRALGLMAVLNKTRLEDVDLVESTLKIFAARAAAELERMHVEAEQQRLQLQLQHTQKLESIGVLAGGIAHDFNNLLMGILGNAGLAKEKATSPSPLRDLLEQVETAGLRAAELTSRLLAYAGRSRIQRQRVDLSDLVQETLLLLKASLSGGTTLDWQRAPGLPAVDGDPAQLRQVVMNLVINASEALEKRGGTVTIRVGRTRLAPGDLDRAVVKEELPAGEYVFLEVADDGAGMTEEVRSRIFDPFFTTKFTGRGLGLAALMGIVRGHRGTVFLDTRPGEGTRFRVVLPVGRQPEAGRPAGEAAAVTPSAAPRQPGRPLTVLVVDDEELVRDLVRSVLSQAGYQVRTAAGGRLALEAARATSPPVDLVVLDLTMPDMDGVQAAIGLAQAVPGIRILVTSGYPEHDVLRRFPRGLVSHFIQKPYRPGELLAAVRRAAEA